LFNTGAEIEVGVLMEWYDMVMEHDSGLLSLTGRLTIYFGRNNILMDKRKRYILSDLNFVF